jgi:hypothetical protein
MAIIDIDRMYWEMKETMLNNFEETANQRFKNAKKLFLESVEDSINQNKEDLIKEVMEEIKGGDDHA